MLVFYQLMFSITDYSVIAVLQFDLLSLHFGKYTAIDLKPALQPLATTKTAKI
jgi:hypothetical protein